jgi:hypothetical protein
VSCVNRARWVASGNHVSTPALFCRCFVLSAHFAMCAMSTLAASVCRLLQPIAGRKKMQAWMLRTETNVATGPRLGDDTAVISNGRTVLMESAACLCKATVSEKLIMAIRKQTTTPHTTGRVVHDSKGNSVWLLNETEQEEFRDTQTWVVRALDVPGLSIDEDTANPRFAADDTDPYNRRK